jgi:hypothetical protein
MWTWVWRSSSALPRAASTRKRVRPSVIAYHDHFAHIETGNVFDPALLEELAPAADRGVVEERRMGGLPAALPMSKSTKAARRVTRQGEDRATKRSTRRDLLRRFAEEARPNPARNSTCPTGNREKLLPALQSVGIKL